VGQIQDVEGTWNKFEISNLKFQILNLEYQISDLKFQISDNQILLLFCFP